MRLRTLPLSLSGVVCGFFLAWADFRQGAISTINFWVLPFLLLTTVCLQILSNMSNELGDHLSGTDGADRQGPMYSLGQGGISVQKFKRTIFFFVVWHTYGLAIVRHTNLREVGSHFTTRGLCHLGCHALYPWQESIRLSGLR